ncbi:MAG: monofunctional biosynthetic peptidoglycan transglycosylase [Litorimonas sp.]
MTETYILSPGDVYGPVQPRQKKHWFGRVFEAGLWVVVIVHLYAIALRVVPVPGTILMVQRGIAGENIRNDWTSLEDISPHLPRAILGGEDSRFCEHRGIDIQAVKNAFSDNAEGGRRRGGSTISQQTAKNVFLWNGGGYPRKAVEAWFALYTDLVWGKRRTMEIYLNVAEWGDGIFGAEAAAQARFGKSAKDLTQREAALLAAVLPSPNKWRVDPPGSYVNGRASILMQRADVIRSSAYDSCLKL